MVIKGAQKQSEKNMLQDEPLRALCIGKDSA